VSSFFLYLAVFFGSASAAEPVLETVESGSINWTRMTLTVTAKGDRRVGAWQGRSIQESDALSRLQPMLMEAARLVRVYPDVRAEALLQADPTANAMVVRQLNDGLNKQIVWRVSETRYLSGGGVEMDAEVDLFTWLSPDLVSKAAGEPQPPTPEGQTGLLLDARHLGFRPCLAPQLQLSDGTALYGVQQVAVPTARELPPVLYVSDPADTRASERAGSQPEFITPQSSTGQCTLVLSEQDSKLLPNRAGLAGWLATARVVIVVGQSP
jgi:hypothetical protein